MLHFKPTNSGDISTIIEWENHPDNKDFIFLYSIAEHQEVIDDKNQLHLKTIDNQGVMIGFIILRGLQNSNLSVELKRIVVNKKGRNYGKMTLQLLQNLVFEKLKKHRLWLDVFTDNPRAQHVYKSVGFVTEGTKRECIKSGNNFRSLIIMSILRQDFKPFKLPS
ncbi:MAG: GNAT family N-acetyltransferase [Saprospiraceae bacterium]